MGCANIVFCERIIFLRSDSVVKESSFLVRRQELLTNSTKEVTKAGTLYEWETRYSVHFSVVVSGPESYFEEY